MGIIGIQYKIKANINICLKQLKKHGIMQTIMITGDNTATAKAIATQAEIDEFYAEILPQDKVTKVDELVNNYASVTMV
ncbi:HAD family hydrolase, partial [Francisella tularensis]|uniref:HAD family hydrolase n=1 Tax=Francisella tularensis TaxID=263 RepID=UPI003F6E176B